jgi:hypothetical protein
MAEAEDVGAASRPFSYRFVTFKGKSEYVCRIIRIFARESVRERAAPQQRDLRAMLA